MVGEKDRALRMPAREGEQLVYGTISIEFVCPQQCFDVVGRFVERQRWKFKRSCLPVEGSLAIGEQCAHQRWLAPREHVRRSAAVMLDHGADEPVERIVRDQEILELVKADNGQPAVRFVQPQRHVEQLEERAAGFVSRWACGHRGKRDVHARELCRHT